MSKTKRFGRKRQVQTVDTPFGKFLVILTHRQLLLSPNLLSNRTYVGQQATELIATIKRMPDKLTLQAIIAAHVHQCMITHGYQSLYPSIFVGVTLSDHHPIWRMIKSRDLAGFICLLDRGEAPLRSYDRNGVSLLQVTAPRTFQKDQ